MGMWGWGIALNGCVMLMMALLYRSIVPSCILILKLSVDLRFQTVFLRWSGKARGDGVCYVRLKIVSALHFGEGEGWIASCWSVENGGRRAPVCVGISL